MRQKLEELSRSIPQKFLRRTDESLRSFSDEFRENSAKKMKSLDSVVVDITLNSSKLGFAIQGYLKDPTSSDPKDLFSRTLALFKQNSEKLNSIGGIFKSLFAETGKKLERISADLSQILPPKKSDPPRISGPIRIDKDEIIRLKEATIKRLAVKLNVKRVEWELAKLENLTAKNELAKLLEAMSEGWENTRREIKQIAEEADEKLAKKLAEIAERKFEPTKVNEGSEPLRPISSPLRSPSSEINPATSTPVHSRPESPHLELLPLTIFSELSSLRSNLESKNRNFREAFRALPIAESRLALARDQLAEDSLDLEMLKASQGRANIELVGVKEARIEFAKASIRDLEESVAEIRLKITKIRKEVLRINFSGLKQIPLLRAQTSKMNRELARRVRSKIGVVKCVHPGFFAREKAMAPQRRLVDRTREMAWVMRSIARIEMWEGEQAVSERETKIAKNLPDEVPTSTRAARGTKTSLRGAGGRAAELEAELEETRGRLRAEQARNARIFQRFEQYDHSDRVALQERVDVLLSTISNYERAFEIFRKENEEGFNENFPQFVGLNSEGAARNRAELEAALEAVFEGRGGAGLIEPIEVGGDIEGDIGWSKGMNLEGGVRRLKEVVSGLEELALKIERSFDVESTRLVSLRAKVHSLAKLCRNPRPTKSFAMAQAIEQAAKMLEEAGRFPDRREDRLVVEELVELARSKIKQAERLSLSSGKLETLQAEFNRLWEEHSGLRKELEAARRAESQRLAAISTNSPPLASELPAILQSHPCDETPDFTLASERQDLMINELRNKKNALENLLTITTRPNLPQSVQAAPVPITGARPNISFGAKEGFADPGSQRKVMPARNISFGTREGFADPGSQRQVGPTSASPAEDSADLEGIMGPKTLAADDSAHLKNLLSEAKPRVDDSGDFESIMAPKKLKLDDSAHMKNLLSDPRVSPSKDDSGQFEEMFAPKKLKLDDSSHLKNLLSDTSKAKPKPSSSDLDESLGLEIPQAIPGNEFSFAKQAPRSSQAMPSKGSLRESVSDIFAKKTTDASPFQSEKKNLDPPAGPARPPPARLDPKYSFSFKKPNA